MRPSWGRRVAKPVAVDISEAKLVAAADHPKLTDADRANMWKSLAVLRLSIIDDLRAEVDRLRASLALAQQTGGRPADCGHQATLAQYDHDRRVCQREHVDEIDRLNAQVARLRAAAVTRECGPF